MSLDRGFDALRRRVQHAEHALTVRERRTQRQWQRLQSTWRAAWTPGRILVIGLALGFASGRARPLRLAGEGGLLGALRALGPLLAAFDAVRAAATRDSRAAPPAD
ncbi:MAG: hypothetical protein J0I72_00760 [Stenotrophomonas sp.]|nr:hypothetical protein [Xanthomonadales bacterium]MBN8767867.1 hypothetical protein [Stenotrophomonas sp.]